MLTHLLKPLLLSLLLTAGTLGTLSTPANAAEAPIYTGLFSKVAVSGYDTVAYFTQHQAVKGDRKFTTIYQGVEWRFSSAENLALFIANPEHYAPQYGGYCAWAVSQDTTASADPQRWKIVNDKLYLNYDDDVQKKWEANTPAFIKAADQHWPKVLQK